MYMYVCMYVCITIYTPVLARVHNSEYKKRKASIKQFCGFNHVHEIKKAIVSFKNCQLYN